MAAWNYSNTALATTLTGAINATQTVIQVQSAAGLPVTAPFTMAIEPGTTSLEIVTVTSVSGTNLTVVRGEDGTSAQSHLSGATVAHYFVARDAREAQQHIYATQNVHGVGSGNDVVGSATTQTLTNKTISGAANTLSNIPNSALVAIDAAKVTQPFATLTTTGAATVGGALAVTGATTLTGGVSGAVAATGAVSGTNVTGSGTVQGATVTSTGAVNGATAAISGNTTVGGTLGVTGTLTGTGTVQGSIVNGTSDVRINGTSVLAQAVPRYATTAARDTAFPTPDTGQLAYVTGVGLMMYSGTAWVGYGPWTAQQKIVTPATSVTFSAIPSTLKELRLTWTARTDAVAAAVGMNLQINGITTASYGHAYIGQANGAAPTTTQAGGAASAYIGACTAASNTAGRFGVGTVTLPGWDGPHSKIGGTTAWGFYDAGVYSSSGNGAFLADVNAPFTSLTIVSGGGNFIANSEFTLVGTY